MSRISPDRLRKARARTAPFRHRNLGPLTIGWGVDASKKMWLPRDLLITRTSYRWPKRIYRDDKRRSLLSSTCIGAGTGASGLATLSEKIRENLQKNWRCKRRVYAHHCRHEHLHGDLSNLCRMLTLLLKIPRVYIVTLLVRLAAREDVSLLVRGRYRGS